jgi:hypothetical protein
MEKGGIYMGRSTKVIATIVGVGMLCPTLVMAQPQERAEGEYARDRLPTSKCGVLSGQIRCWGGGSGSWWCQRFLTGGNERAAEGICIRWSEGHILLPESLTENGSFHLITGRVRRHEHLPSTCSTNVA